VTKYRASKKITAKNLINTSYAQQHKHASEGETHL